MSEEINVSEQPTFDAAYVKQLRDENASWRHKYRELEEKTLYQDLNLEFAKRGINIDPRIVNIPEGMTAADVAETFSEVFTPAQQEETPARAYPAGLTPNPSNANGPGPSPQGAFGSRTLKEMEADPKAREQIRGLYREMLRGNSYTTTDSIYDN